VLQEIRSGLSGCITIMTHWTGPGGAVRELQRGTKVANVGVRAPHATAGFLCRKLESAPGQE
jgi:hypothetical protein